MGILKAGKLSLPWFLTGALFLAGAAVTLPWIIVFGDEIISRKPSEWAYFGDYFGGTLSSLISALALIALLVNLKQQQTQISHLKRQMAKEDMIKAIDRLEMDFDSLLSKDAITLNGDDGSTTINARDVLFSVSFQSYKEVLINEAEFIGSIDESASAHRDDSRVKVFEMFSLAAGELNQIRIYAEELEKLTGNNVLSRYYHRKYKTAYERLLEKGILSKQWNVNNV